MEAKDLMINDLVYVYDSIVKVRAISNDLVGYFKTPCDGSYCTFEKYVKPIPLTEEILKANGIPTYGKPFSFPDNYKLELTYENGVLNWTVNYAEYFIMELRYVHELQHALRLCGLNIIADNFKIPNV